ncbi:MAG TPA: c-type cytochrome [Terracidiphilus sp.]|nr:c-type cytochrome [Terracidiphilus sp.]
MRTTSIRGIFVASLLGISITLLCSYTPTMPAQSANTPFPEAHPIYIPDRFTNLKVLPPEIRREHLISVMNGFSRQLGVHCSFCHVLNSGASEADFASDLKPEKRSARVMIRMTQAINSRYLTEIPETLKGQRTVTCDTCHQGHALPPGEQNLSAGP